MISIENKSPKDCALLVEKGWTYLDVRTVEEFAGGHPKDAWNVPVMTRGPNGMQPNHEFLVVVQRRFPQDAKLIVGCASGVRSVRACEMLQTAGYKSVVNMENGFQGARDGSGEVVTPGWQGCKLPVSSTPKPGRAYADLRAG